MKNLVIAEAGVVAFARDLGQLTVIDGSPTEL
jgi:hypothetical protein